MIAERFPPDRGGLAVSSLRIAAGLVRTGTEAHVLATDRRGHDGGLESAKEGDVVVHRVGSLKNDEYTMMTACRIVELLHKRHPFDAIMGMYIVKAGYIAAFEGKMLGVPSLVMARGNDVDREMFRPEGIPYVMGALNMATAVGCVSKELMSKCRALTGKDNVYYTPNGVDTALFSPGKKDAKLLKKLGISGPVIGFSGELRLKKGMSHIVAAAEKLHHEFPDVKFLLLGGVRAEDKVEFKYLNSEVSEIKKVFIDTGYVTDRREVVKMYRLMDALFMPSFWEGMPNAALEAMACGVPAVASTAGGLRELVGDGVTGYSFLPGDIGGAIEALRKILGMPLKDREKMGSYAREVVLKNHTLDSEIINIQRILSNMV